MVCIKVIFNMVLKQYEAECSVNDEKAKPLSGAVVTLSSDVMEKASKTTDATGIVKFSPLKKGAYTGVASHADYEDLTENFTVPAAA